MKNIKSILLITFITIYFISFGQIKDSKPRYNFKIAFSLNRVFEAGDYVWLFTTDKYENGVCSNEKFRLQPNFRIEANYLFTKSLEVGIYAGYFNYNVYDVTIQDTSYSLTHTKVFAPTFGVNCNFHFLHFMNYSKLKNLDIYLIFKYGGAYLPKWGGEYEYPIYDYYRDPIYSKFRSSYCFGLGGSYTIWKRIGLYSELTFGKHSYFPDIDLKSNIAFRGGIVFSI